MNEFECGEYLFSSNFDSGNLRKVELVRSCPETEATDYVIHAEFNLWTSPDCYGTPYENPNRTWFFFSVKGGRPFRNIKLNVRNLNRQAKLFSQGMQPVMRIGENGKWERIKDKPAYATEGEGFYISFIHRTNDAINIPQFYAFTYPFTYNECLNLLDKFDKKYGKSLQDVEYITNRISQLEKDEKEQVVKKVDTTSKTKMIAKETIINESNMDDISLVPSPLELDNSSGSQSSSISEALYDKMSKRELQNEIYYHRELLINSLQNRRVELLTISSFSGMRNEFEERLSNLFPDGETPRCRTFKDKKIIFMSSRVHPGETASSFVLNGFLNLILDKKSLIGQTLRQLYVFKIVPFLNPDGVYNGLYRTDTLGQNLNRMYICPQIDKHPSIYGVKKLIKYYHLGYDRFDEDNKRIALLEQSKIISPVTAPNRRKPAMKDEVCSTASLFDLVDKMRSGTSKSENDIESQSQSFSSKETTSSEGEENSGTTIVQNLATPNSSSEGKIFTEKLIPEIKAIAQEPMPKTISPTVSGVGNKPSDPLYRKNSAFKTVFGSIHAGSINRSTENKLKDLQNTTTVQRPKYKKVLARKDVKPCNQLTLKALNKKNLLCCQNIDISSEHDGIDKVDKSNLFLYMDFHGHASKKGIFMYGNHFQSTHEAVECMLLPRLMGMNCHHFHYESCNFSERNMYRREKRDGLSKEGSGRVAVFKMTGLIKCYTLESNYNTGKYVNTLPSRMKETNQKPPSTVPPKYTPGIYEEVGRALGPSILDITNSNTISRIYNSEYRSVQALRIAIRNEVERHGSQRAVLNSGKILSTSQKRVKRGSLAVVSTSNDVPKENKAIYQGKISPWDLAVPSSSTQNPSVSILQSLNQPSTKISQRAAAAARCIRRNPLKVHSTNLYGKKDATTSKIKSKSVVLVEASCSTNKKDHSFPIPLKKVRVSPTHNPLLKDVLPPVKKSSTDSSSSSAETSYKEKPTDNAIVFEPTSLTEISPKSPTSSDYSSLNMLKTDKHENQLTNSLSMTQFYSGGDQSILKKCTSESGLDIYAAGKLDLSALAIPSTSKSSFKSSGAIDDAVPSCSPHVIVHGSSTKPILATFRKTKKADGFLVKGAGGNLTSSLNPKMKNAFGGSENSKLGKKKRIIRHDSLIVKRKKNKTKITRH